MKKLFLIFLIILFIVAMWFLKTNISENSSDKLSNETNNIIYEKEGTTVWGINENGDVVYKKTDELEDWFEKDEAGKMIHTYDSDGYESWIEYNEDGNMIYQKNNEGFEAWYNENGECIKAIY